MKVCLALALQVWSGHLLGTTGQVKSLLIFNCHRLLHCYIGTISQHLVLGRHHLPQFCDGPIQVDLNCSALALQL